MIEIFIGILLLAFIFYAVRGVSYRKWYKATGNFPQQWREILREKVSFYQKLSSKEKIVFEERVHDFIINNKFIGVDVSVDDVDKVLVASSAIIPVFSFPDWQYHNLEYIQLYPAMFDEKFATSGKGRRILGMVGTGYMEGKMILSKPALHQGFANETDKKNTAIHEFIHLLDKQDGYTDGVPKIFIKKQYIIPWVDLIKQEIDKIREGDSDINVYGGTNKTEFLAVIGEYFFERPKLLKKKHPELYIMLEKIFIK
jgi:Mlc titration factor MtfA (ptsG expression regulator)